eukprot:PhM_4_TR11512/c0_g2_i1/m.40833/K03773/fklB; FKBP-type peptidyl-prolyl cis-trans isomerase FklB
MKVWSMCLVAVALVVVLCAASASAAPDNKKMSNYHKRSGAKFLEEKAKEEGVYKLPSGMLFKVLKKGDGAKSPKANDDCDVHYSGTLRDGTKFDSSYDRGTPATFKPTQVIKGWTEALQMMAEGDKWQVFIPYNIAYGEHGSPPKIPPFSPLVFEMELIKVKGKGKPVAEARAEIEKKIGKKWEDL